MNTELPTADAARWGVSAKDRWCSVIREFFSALFDPFTYSPRQNPDFVFGLLWGIPIPIFALLIHRVASGKSCDLAFCLDVLLEQPLYFIFLLHPLLFGALFGTLGTLRWRRDRHILRLVGDLECRCQELCLANARLTELDKLKSEFLANVTHELKSPLVTALGYTDRNLSGHLGPVTERQSKALQVSKRNLVRLRALIDEILDFSRLEAGVAGFSREPVDFREVLTIAQENLSLFAKVRKVAIKLRQPPERLLVHGDQGKLVQVLVNLLDNAIKYSPENSEISVFLAVEAGKCHVQVKDQGAGIPAEIMPRLFQRFVQADGSYERPHNGVGLGLVIVKKIVEAHDGRVWIESTPGSGTTVHVELPVCAAPPVERQNEVGAATPGLADVKAR